MARAEPASPRSSKSGRHKSSYLPAFALDRSSPSMI